MDSINLKLKQYWFFSLTIFVSAFLLFQIQPMMSKYILPWFGGGSSVWTTSQLFFQVMLVVGYGYAFVLSRFHLKTQTRIHALVLGVVLLWLIVMAVQWGVPLLPDARWKPTLGNDFPGWQVLLVLLVSVGLPYFLLSTTSSLLQSWFSRIYQQQSPYSFYVLSNAASFFALLSYPFLFEPVLALHQQAIFWTEGFGVFLAVLIFTAWRVSQQADQVESELMDTAADAEDLPEVEAVSDGQSGWVKAMSIINLSTCGSVLLLATTNQITQDVASVPFLWVLPLSLYLLSFIFGFTQFVEKRRGWMVVLMMIALLVALIFLADPAPLPAWMQILANSFVMFIGCLLCHSELYRQRPDARHVTTFYLLLAVGGAIGGILVGLVAPLLFRDFWEYPAALVICADVLVTIAFQETRGNIYRLRITITSVSLVTAGMIILMRYVGFSSAIEVTRDFYGVQRVRLDDYGGIQAYSLVSGSIVHGVQAVNPAKRTSPPGYYTESSGAALAFRQNAPRLSGQPVKAGVVGLGTGTMAFYGQKGDDFRFYEIDPQVIQVAHDDRYFTYLRDSAAKISIIEGDGRLSLERALAQGEEHSFDLLFLDAFSGDSVPTHLISREAIALYQKLLKPDGLMVFNISNKYLDLEPVLWQAQQTMGLHGVFVQGKPKDALGFPSRWVILSAGDTFFKNAEVQSGSRPLQSKPGVQLWTDDYSNLLQVLR